MDNHFTIIIPSYNCKDWVLKNLNSVFSQVYNEYSVVYIDDASTDGTAAAVTEYVENNNISDDSFKLIANPFNKGKMENLYYAVQEAQDNTIVVVLDGDDWLASPNVLQILNKVYNSDDIWMTNGSYVIDPSNQVVSPQINESYWAGIIRKKSWEFSHLGSFRKELFCKIKRKDLMNKQGEFWATTSDQAIMWPMAEMAGPKHFRAIKEVLYVYNRNNPLSDDRAHRSDQLLTEQVIRNKSPYDKLEIL